jgi:hypothetical protein
MGDCLHSADVSRLENEFWYDCKERTSPSILMAQRDNVLVPLTKAGKSNKRERARKRKDQ